MTQTDPDAWRKLAECWVGISAKTPDFAAWMHLNLNPPAGANLPPEALQLVESDPRAARFLRRTLRDHLNWNNGWVDWMPNNEISKLLLEPQSEIERTVALAGAVCCREAIAKTISKPHRTQLRDLLGDAVLMRLTSRPFVGRIRRPIAAVCETWSGAPDATIRFSGSLCLRIAVAPFPVALSSRLAALVPNPAWETPLEPPDSASIESATSCLHQSKSLDQPT